VGCDVSLGRAKYFQYLTVSDRLESEGRACLQSTKRRPEFRDKVGLTFGHLQSGRPGAQLLGFTVAVILASHDGLRLLMQDRSMKTGVAGSRRALIPAYVCEPCQETSNVSDFPLCDFLREFVEELYPNEYEKGQGAASADWYYDVRPIPEL